MPIYEYCCTACGHQLEAIQKISDSPLKQCPECQKETLQKLISAAGFQLKGTGWYVTDFRNKGKSESKDKPAQSETKGQGDNKSGSSTEKGSNT